MSWWCIFLQANPAIWVLALGASHVIAPIKLVAWNSTIRTKLTIVALLPVVEFFLKLPTLFAFVSFLATFEANINPTFALDYLLKHSSFPDKSIAARRRAPFKLGVEIHVNVHLELEELFVDFLRAKLSHIIVSEGDLTAYHHAGYLNDVAIFNIVLQVLLHAFLAILVATTEAKESRLVKFFIANIASSHLSRWLDQRSNYFFFLLHFFISRKWDKQRLFWTE